MIRTLTFSIASALLLAAAGPAAARGDRDRDQDNLREAPYSNMTYLGGPQFDARQMVYALKFMDGSQVVIVYVDARTGRIVGRRP